MDLVTELVIFVLAAFVGFAVISKVPTTLHTPLMSQTNAIHGIVMLGGLIVAGVADGFLEQLIGFIAIAFGAINIVGGFMVTDRMLGMFVRKPKARRGGAEAMNVLAVLEPGGDATVLLYTVSFSLFIYGLMQGTHPRTAKNGNLIAAGGMAIAVITTLLLDGLGNWGVIIGGLAVGSAVGVIASLRVQMTEMPQMVALYNGVGGGAVALIAWSEFRHAPPDVPLDELIPVLFAAVIGSVSFWGSNIAFAKLQDLIPTRPLAIPGQQVINAAAAGRDPRRLRRPRLQQRRSERLRGPVHRRADRRGAARQPRRAADRRRRHAGRDLAAERGHRPLRRGRRVRARQRRPDRRRHPGRLLGNDPDDGDGDGDEPLGRQHPLLRLRRRARRREPARARSARTPRSAPRTRRSSSPTPTRS